MRTRLFLLILALAVTACSTPTGPAEHSPGSVEASADAVTPPPPPDTTGRGGTIGSGN